MLFFYVWLLSLYGSVCLQWIRLIKKQTLNAIHKLSNQHPVTIRWDSIKVIPSRSGVQFSHIQIQRPHHPPIQWKTLTVKVAILPSLFYRSLLFSLEVDRFEYDWLMQPKSFEQTNENWENWTKILNIPVYQIVFNNALLRIKTKYQSVLLHKLYLKIINKQDSIYVKTNLQSQIQDKSFFEQSQFHVQQNRIKIIEMQIQKPQFQMDLSGFISGSLNQLHSLQLNVHSDLTWENLATWWSVWSPKDISDVSGNMQLQTQISYTKQKRLERCF